MLSCCSLLHRKRYRWLRFFSILCCLIFGAQLRNEQLFWSSTLQRNINRDVIHMNATEHQLVSRHQPTNTKTSYPADSSPFLFEAYSPNGSLGYIADPSSLRSGLMNLEESLRANTTNHDPTALFWYALANYEQSTRGHSVSVSSTEVCSFGPGQGLEEEGGWKLLTEKIRLHNDQSQDHHISSSGNKNEDNNNSNSIRLLCAIYTHAPMQHQARAAALTWGKQCDGFLAFSTETVQSLGIIYLRHSGPESYFNMWQKVRSIWAYIAMHYAEQFDYIHLCGDDTYILVENLRHFLVDAAHDNNSNKPMHWGQWIRQKHAPYAGGGPGYTINRAALRLFAEHALHSCNTEAQASFEDRLFSHCIQSLGVMPGDTRDKKTGAQRYHDASPQQLYASRIIPKQKRPSFHARGMVYWESLPFPDQYPTGVWRPFVNNTMDAATVGPKHHLESAATYSVAFHNIFNPLYMSRVHAILNPSLCPLDSPLRRGLDYYAVA